MILRNTPELIAGSVGVAQETGNVVYSTRAQVEDYVLAGERMALLCAWNGRQEVSLEGRRLAASWMILTRKSSFSSVMMVQLS